MPRKRSLPIYSSVSNALEIIKLTKLRIWKERSKMLAKRARTNRLPPKLKPKSSRLRKKLTKKETPKIRRRVDQLRLKTVKTLEWQIRRCLAKTSRWTWMPILAMQISTL